MIISLSVYASLYFSVELCCKLLQATILLEFTGDDTKPSSTHDLFGTDSSGWELALVTTASSNTSQLVESKLVRLLCGYIGT